MSPLTKSYFTCWAFFDACAGPANETIGTTILETGAAFGMHPELLRLIRLMQDSRMGFYIHRGRDRKSTRLNSSHGYISYAAFCLKKKKSTITPHNSNAEL